jgi:hypothetical protein
VWDADSNLVASSLNADSLDRVDFTPRVSGLYQVEVYGYADLTTYILNFQAAAPSPALTGSQPAGPASGKTARSQPTTQTGNVPLTNNPKDSAPIVPEPSNWLVYLPTLSRH